MELIADAGCARKKIMIVDDDSLVLQIACEMLEGAGYEVIPLGEGEDVIETAWAHQPDALILDCALPGKPGMVVLEELRSSPLFATLPIAMLTARRSDMFEQAARSKGADAYIRKPFDRVDLLVAVAKIIRDS